MKLSFFSLLIVLTVFCSAQNIKPLFKKDNVSFRGLSALNDSVFLVSGSNGTVLQTNNGGKTFINISPKGYEKHDFRDIEVFNDSTAVVMGIASPGVLLLTQNNGENWKEIYRDEHKNVFLNSISYTTPKDDSIGNILAIGDPVDNQFIYAINLAKKENNIFKQTVKHEFVVQKLLHLILLAKGEAFFAASGTNIYTNENIELIASGGKESNLYYSNNRLKNTIAKYTIPILQGKESTGANSIDFNPKTHQGYIVGGDFLAADLIEGNAVGFTITDDSIKFSHPQTPPNGYRSCVNYLNDSTIITCGINGVDISYDRGENWKLISKEGFHVCLKSKTGNKVFFAGSKGRIAVWENK